MVIDSKTLVSDGGTLELICNDANWCQLSLRVQQNEYRLGAEVRQIVVSRLIQGLDEHLPPATAGMIAGIHVCWVCSLAEGHYSIYAADHAGRRCLFFQDPSGNLAAKLELSGMERLSWLAQLAG
ncbi:MAG: hypothetical protein ABJB12_11965 [Pseudomonadota bacterium]